MKRIIYISIISVAILVVCSSYNMVDKYNGALIPFCKGKQWGFADTNRKVIIKCNYDKVQPFIDGVALVISDNALGMIDTKGKTVIGFGKYELITYLYNGLIQVTSGGKSGFVNRQYKEIVSCKYDAVVDYDNYKGFVQTRAGEKWNVVTREGKELFKNSKYSDVSFFLDAGMIRVTLKKKYGFCDTLGKEIVSPKYDDCQFIEKTKFAWAKQGDKKALLDITGKELSAFDYDEITGFTSNLFKIKKGDKLGVINGVGKEIVPCNFDMIVKFDTGIVFVMKDKKYGLYNLQGKEVAPCKYDWISDFDNKAFTSVQINGKEFYIDNKGAEYIE